MTAQTPIVMKDARIAMDGIKDARVDVVAARSPNGQPKALDGFHGAITDLLSDENKQWQEGTAQANASLAKARRTA